MDTLQQQTTQFDPLIVCAAEIVNAFVSKNAMPASDVSGFLKSIFETLKRLASGHEETQLAETLTPAVSIKKSVTNDFIICLEDGKKFKSLRRHLGTAYKMTPDQYRAKWGLRPDYPMVAPGYSVKRSALAKSAGLGRKAEPKPSSAAEKTSKAKAQPKKKTASAKLKKAA